MMKLTNDEVGNSLQDRTDRVNFSNLPSHYLNYMEKSIFCSFIFGRRQFINATALFVDRAWSIISFSTSTVSQTRLKSY